MPLISLTFLDVYELKTKDQTGISQYFLNSHGTACLHDNNTLKTNAKPFFSVACSKAHIHKKTAYELLAIVIWTLVTIVYFMVRNLDHLVKKSVEGISK